MVWYELQRGLLAKNAKSQIARAEALINNFDWHDYNHADWTLAAELWIQRRIVGRPIADADLMIAVFAINREAVLVTDNEKDFDGLDVNLQNWKD